MVRNIPGSLFTALNFKGFRIVENQNMVSSLCCVDDSCYTLSISYQNHVEIELKKVSVIGHFIFCRTLAQAR